MGGSAPASQREGSRLRSQSSLVVASAADRRNSALRPLEALGQRQGGRTGRMSHVPAGQFGQFGHGLRSVSAVPASLCNAPPPPPPPLPAPAAEAQTDGLTPLALPRTAPSSPSADALSTATLPLPLLTDRHSHGASGASSARASRLPTPNTSRDASSRESSRGSSRTATPPPRTAEKRGIAVAAAAVAAAAEAMAADGSDVVPSALSRGGSSTASGGCLPLARVRAGSVMQRRALPSLAVDEGNGRQQRRPSGDGAVYRSLGYRSPPEPSNEVEVESLL